MTCKYWTLSGSPLNAGHLRDLLSAVRSCWMKDNPGVTADQIRDWEISVTVENDAVRISYVVEG